MPASDQITINSRSGNLRHRHTPVFSTYFPYAILAIFSDWHYPSVPGPRPSCSPPLTSFSTFRWATFRAIPLRLSQNPSCFSNSPLSSPYAPLRLARLPLCRSLVPLCQSLPPLSSSHTTLSIHFLSLPYPRLPLSAPQIALLLPRTSLSSSQHALSGL